MSKQDFSIAAVIMHWVLAASLLFLFVSSWWMLALPYNEYRVLPFQLHKNLGITLLLLLVLFLFVRLRHRPAPIASPSYQSWMHKLALVTHISLYVLLFLVCLSGLLSTTFSGWGTTLWWLIELPNWGREDKELYQVFTEMHSTTSWLLLAVMTVHVMGALYHAFRCDGVVRRMMHL